MKRGGAARRRGRRKAGVSPAGKAPLPLLSAIMHRLFIGRLYGLSVFAPGVHFHWKHRRTETNCNIFKNNLFVLQNPPFNEPG
jgi:hypothetical protein